MTNFKLTIAYDGRPFHGWQRQPEASTVQGRIEAAMLRMNAGQPLLLTGASRTDAGVHAEGQAATFSYSGAIDARTWLRGLNGLTPDSITIRSVDVMPPEFHPRHHARGKHYRYLLWHGSRASPRWRPLVWEHRRPLDLDAMVAASRCLLGEHDFAAFRAGDCEARTTIRRLTRIDFTTTPWAWTRPRAHEAQALVRVDIEGTAFLKYMIRIIMGTLVDVGLGLRDPSSLPDILASRQRARAGRTAPSRGLTLVEVFYPQDLAFGPPRRIPDDETEPCHVGEETAPRALRDEIEHRSPSDEAEP